MKSSLKYAGRTAVTLFVLLTSNAVTGYVLVILWKWFVVPAFKAAPLTFVQGIGIALIVSYLTEQDISDLKREQEAEPKYMDVIQISCIRSVGTALLALFAGWMYHQLL